MPLHPVIKRHIKKWYEQGMDKLYLQPIEEVRKILLRAPEIPPFVHLDYVDFSVNRTFSVRVFYPPKLRYSPSPVVLYLRSSANALGTIENHNIPCSLLAKELECIVIGVEHRLAPEYPHPIGVDDCEEAVYWATHYAKELNIDPSQMYLWGECSGATSSACVASRLLEKKMNLIQKQVLFYPVFDSEIESNSRKQFGEGYIFDNNLCEFFASLSMRTKADREKDSPCRAKSFEGYPETTLHVGEYDMFLDECKYFYEKVKSQGSTITLNVHNGLNHGFIQYYPHIPEIQMMIAKEIYLLKKSFHQTNMASTRQDASLQDDDSGAALDERWGADNQKTVC